ncbi:MAG: response regulator [Saprospiraceae bacterium]|nr:response regulator [Saprospiraceae bacterium]
MITLPAKIKAPINLNPIPEPDPTIGTDVYRVGIQNPSAEPVQLILYLHNAQLASVFLQQSDGQRYEAGKAGLLTPPHERSIPKGLIIPGFGYSAQLKIQLEPGFQELSIVLENKIPKSGTPVFQLYTPELWSEKTAVVFEQSVSVHLLAIGALLIMALYHLLAFVQRRDMAFLWYSVYTLAVSSVLMVESGVIQAYITRNYPMLNLLYRYLQPHAFLSYVVYWFFLRNFIGLKQLLPRLDWILLRFLWIFSVLSLLFWMVFVLNIEYQWGNINWLTYAMPIAALLFGLGAYFYVFRIRNKLVQLFTLGSLVLLLGVLTNTLISAAIEFRWVADFPFPHFYITEIAVIAEILIFALALNYRFQLLDYERRRIKDLDETKSKFFANISHEFRTPLTVISGLAGQIKGNAAEAALIRRNSNSLLGLVNALLELSKLDAGQLKLEYITADIIAFLRYLTESFYSLAEAKSIALTFDTAEEDLLMNFDESCIQQMVSNLISNAIKFTPERGAVCLSAKKTLKSGKPYLLIAVSDTGVGIASAEKERIFDRFYQSDGPARNRPNSSGIGLALTKELVRLAGGSIEVTSEESLGATFSIYLPIAVSHEAGHVRAVFPAAESDEAESFRDNPIPGLAEKQHLLIIEDNRDIVYYLEKVLQARYQISVASDGQQGIAMALENIPDIIISDVMMPEKDGFEVCSTLKEDWRTSHIPIILLTAKAAQEDKISGLKHGADAYLMKPFDPEELLVRLEKLLELRQALQKKYSDPANNQNRAATANPTLEERFLWQLREAAEKVMSDPENAIARLERELQLSQMQLYRKLKALTGLTPSLYIRSVRLQKALQLLQTTDLNISEVAYEVGFTSPAYFSRAFSEEFGRPPSGYRN